MKSCTGFRHQRYAEMAGHRLCYGLLLAAAVILYIFYEAFLSWYLLLLVLLCPIFSLLISLPAMVRAELSIQAPEETVMGQPCLLRIQSSRGTLLPFGRLTFTASVTDAAGQYIMQPKSYTLSGYGGASLNLHAPAAHCGILRVTVRRARVTDLLGLFSRRLRPVKPSMTLVLPVPVQPDILPAMPEAAPMTIRPGGGPAEDYALRTYRPGDAVRSIHWKLTARLEEPVVREALVPVSRHLDIAAAPGGSPSAVDRTLSHLLWLSSWLLEQEISHTVYWLDAEGRLQQESAADLDAQHHLLRMLLTAPFPEQIRYPEIQAAFRLDEEAQSP